MNCLSRIAILVLLIIASLVPALSRGKTPDAVPRISNGEICEECGFGPGVVSLRAPDGNCTGTLIHPEMVLYAAHCGEYIRTEFTHVLNGGRSVRLDHCKTHPSYGPDGRSRDWDFAYCILEEPITDIPIIPAAFGCEIEMFMKVDQPVTLCGFGYYTDISVDYRKRFGESRITELHGSASIGYGDLTVGPHDGVVACPGDSGGPLLVQMKDGSWRTIGITSLYSGECGGNGTNTYRAVRTAVEWIEEESGIDITPCFTDNGTWYPTEDCGGFWASPDNTPYGTWEEGCPGTPVSDYSDACGPPFPEFEPDTSLIDTDTETETETETETDTEDPGDEKDDDGCGCSAVGFNPSPSLIERLF